MRLATASTPDEAAPAPSATLRVPAATAEPARRRARGLRRRPPAFDLAILLVFTALALWVLALDLYQVIVHHRIWTGTDGSYVVDQMQYLSWIRGGSVHGLASNLFVLRPTPADYFQPAVAVSSAVTALGAAPWLSYLLWKPVAILATFIGARSYVRRSITGIWPQRAALVLGLFFVSYSVVYGSRSVVGDLMPAYLLWGYPLALLSVAAILFALLAYDRARASRRLVWSPALLGAFASSLHPWQGETLILIVISAEALVWLRNRHPAPGAGQEQPEGQDPARAHEALDRERLGQGLRRRLALPAVTVIGTALPLAYYGILGRTDLSWRLAREGSKHSFSLWAILLAIAPLALPALLGYRGRAQGFLAVATRTWPFAALGVFVVSGTALAATPLHAFVGITFPLAVLAVAGLQRAGWHRIPRRRLVGALAVAAVTVPATVFEMRSIRSLVAPGAGNPSFITRDERDALDYLARDPEPGGVLTRYYLGTIVPVQTGRRSFVGNCLWSQPDCDKRAVFAQRLIEGAFNPPQALAFVQGSGARFVLADCGVQADLRQELAPITQSVRTFGCATLYIVGGSASRPPDRVVIAGRRTLRLGGPPSGHEHPS
jgi:hypothetical protein